ncbi:hypothetical protein KAFR_0B06220 [Kazachstania africana CBS 2517]|uniref:FHA domain-containing protein n=1 Tax=Kazachstania africana (strain ATCC 22294 / BCRC 22015 / CBS 2517 / CECT 1963 / NBRC 1671 / NRRL Y-8276) TaxID=1071382 RepID=H2ARB9_KAZAF|nr:hypothetical protein KAFR_0B06220 [Kazachstania africana CBS 2517]CCF56919.1 hypothetical protein KAFR_0B06220 [Kazachstania africana CBS 2517]
MDQYTDQLKGSNSVKPVIGLSARMMSELDNKRRQQQFPSSGNSTTRASPNKQHRPTGRTRSNSRSSGSRSQSDYDQFTQEVEQSQLLSRSIPNNPIATTSAPITNVTVQPRSKYIHIIVLKSLNATFEAKYLVVPFKPDILKLGRPVVNSNSGNNNNTTNKKDSNALVRPDNGNFDSRVLSRSHACLSCDALTGKIYIRDLKSSNGTFVNGSRISQTDVELKIGDIIDLGTDIDSKFEHRKISALVEEISVIPLINNISPEFNGESDIGQQDQTKSNTNDILTENKIITNNNSQVEVTATTAQRAAFEAAMFGDVNNLDLEDSILGPETEILSGIFINNSIGTSPNLINIIKALSTEIALEKQELAKLKSMENFLVNYTTNLDYINKLMVDMNDKQLIKLQNTLKKSFNEKHEIYIKETKEKFERFKTDKELLKARMDEKETVYNNQLKKLEMEIDDMKTRLEVEKYKNSKFNQKDSKTVKDESEATSDTDEMESFQEDGSVKKGQNYGNRKKTGKFVAISAASAGVIALLIKLSLAKA